MSCKLNGVEYVDWKLASIIGMLVALGLNIVITATPLTVFVGTLVIPVFNYLLHLWGCKIVHGRLDNKAYIRKMESTDRPSHVLYYTLDGENKSRYFFGDDAKENANEFLNKLKEPSFTVC
jgi:hypothetical protein